MAIFSQKDAMFSALAGAILLIGTTTGSANTVLVISTIMLSMIVVRRWLGRTVETMARRLAIFATRHRAHLSRNSEDFRITLGFGAALPHAGRVASCIRR